MAVRSKRFLSSSSVPSGTAGAEYTVPSGATALVKCATGYASSGTTATTLVVECTPSGGTATRLVNVALPVDTSTVVTLFFIAGAGDVLRLRRGAGTLQATLSGALLDGNQP